jgi:hypothetical protein
VERTDDVAVAMARGSGAPTAVRWYSLGLCAAAVGAGLVLLAAGAALPTLGPILLLAIAAGLCVNRFALFPSEHAATAEAAVLLAAVVGFRGDAAFLGPLAVALLVGPLDALHWEQRSFVRMAYNAGNRGVATLAAAATLAGTHELLGGTTLAWVAVLLLSASAFALLDLALSVALLQLHGDRFCAALAHLLDVDVLTLPIACIGAAAGLLAGEVGWWATVLALLPAAFLPELVIARAHARAAAVRDVAALLVVVAVLATIALITPLTTTATLAVLCLIAVLAGVELAPDRGALVAPMTALVVVAACVVLDDDRVRVGAALVAVIATLTSWWCERGRLQVRLVAAVSIAAVAASLAAQLAVEVPRTVLGVGVGALGAGVVFAAVAVVTGSERRRHGVATLWCAPVLATAVAGAAVWRNVGLVGAAAYVVMTTSVLLGWAWWGAPAWRSRVIGRRAPRPPARVLPWTFTGCAIAAMVAAIVGVSVSDHAGAVTWSWCAAGLGDVAAAMAAAGVRQWRFAPRPRVIGLSIVVLATATLIGGAAPLAARGSPWGVVVVVAVMSVLACVARVPARQVRAADTHELDSADAR